MSTLLRVIICGLGLLFAALLVLVAGGWAIGAFWRWSRPTTDRTENEP